MVDVAVPANFESEFKFGPFTVARIIRLTLYLVIVGILTFMVNVAFIILFLVVLFMVLYRREGMDLDLYLLRTIKYTWEKRKFFNESTKEIIRVKSIKGNILETDRSYNIYIQVQGTSAVLLSPEAVSLLYDNFVGLVNTLDFDFEVRTYPTSLDVNHITSSIDENNLPNENMKRLAKDYKKLITAISENILYPTTIFIIYHNKRYSPKEPESYDDIKRELEERASIVLSSLLSMGFTAVVLSDTDLLDMLKDIYAGVKVIGVPLS